MNIYDKRVFIFVMCLLVLLLAGGCSKETGGDSGELEAEIARLRSQVLELEAELAGGEDNETFLPALSRIHRQGGINRKKCFVP